MIELDVIVKGTTEEETNILCSNLVKEISDSYIRFIGENMVYKCLLDKFTVSEVLFDILEQKYSMGIYMVLTYTESYMDQITETMNRITTKTINVPGNEETPVIVEITPSVGIIDIVLTGLSEEPITIRILTGGKKVIIDGEEGLVTVDGVNKFGDTDMWEFPRLKPGANTITVSRNNVDINIKYKPRFI